MPKTIVITGASTGFGALTARALAGEGHIVYAGMRDVAGTDAAADDEQYARERSVALHPVAMDVTDQDMVDAAVSRVIGEAGRIDVIIHNAGHMVLGPAEAEVARQIARVVDLPKGTRPFRVHIDPMHDGAEEVFNLGDRIRQDFFHRIGLEDLLRPALS